MNYKQAIDYIYSFTNFEVTPAGSYSSKTFDLHRMELLLSALGHPEQSFRSVHIAGTKGKGSTAAMIESILRQAGFHTGLYTSPHLHTFRERIRADGEFITRDSVVAQVESLRPVVSNVPGATTFEVMTAMALSYFSDQNIDIAVLETGLGGRLDATNVVMPIVSVLTSISYDHIAILGNTLNQIAAEKAGIIKPGVPVVVAPQMKDAEETIRRVASEMHASVVQVTDDLSFDVAGSHHTVRAVSSDPSSQTISIHTDMESRSLGCHLPLVGKHQLVNATTALATIEVLRRHGLTINERAICSGLESVQWPGRFEVLSLAPALVVDGAHNADSARQLIQTIKTLFPNGRLHVIFGASSDKDINGMLSEIMPYVTSLVLTRSHNPRASEPSRLAQMANGNGFEKIIQPDMQSAIQSTMATAGKDDIICVTGSLFVVAEARAIWYRSLGKPVEADPE